MIKVEGSAKNRTGSFNHYVCGQHEMQHPQTAGRTAQSGPCVLNPFPVRIGFQRGEPQAGFGDVAEPGRGFVFVRQQRA